MIEPVVRDALAAAGPQASVLDLGCNEGWFAHRALEWGAARVVGLDVREANVRRASLIREHFGIDRERLRFEQANVLELDPAQLGTFDVVLVLGLIYHLENPVGALRIGASGHRRDRGRRVTADRRTTSRFGSAGARPACSASRPAHWATVLEPAERAAR